MEKNRIYYSMSVNEIPSSLLKEATSQSAKACFSTNVPCQQELSPQSPEWLSNSTLLQGLLTKTLTSTLHRHSKLGTGIFTLRTTLKCQLFS